MFKQAAAAGLILGLALWHPVQSAVPAEADGNPPAKVKPTPKQIRAKLNERIDFPGVDVSTPLKDALNFIAFKYEVNIVIDEKAFEAIGVQKVGEQAATLGKMDGVRLSTVLHLLLGQVKGDVYSGTFLVKPDGIHVTSSYEALLDVLGPEGVPTDLLGKQPNRAEPIPPAAADLRQVIHLDIQEKPLRDALRELAEREGINVIVDPRAGDKAKTAVSATLNNVLAGTAIRLLADMADLKVVIANNVFYVTTKENARELEQEQQKRKDAKEPQP